MQKLHVLLGKDPSRCLQSLKSLETTEDDVCYIKALEEEDTDLEAVSLSGARLYISCRKI
jgi:hypothetical protein